MDNSTRRRAALIALAACVAIAGGVAFLNLRGGGAPDLSESVTVRFDDTGEEVTMNRGQFERSVLARAFREKRVDPKVGMGNPKTGKPTGFPVDRGYWERLVGDANSARDSAENRAPSNGSNASRPGGK